MTRTSRNGAEIDAVIGEPSGASAMRCEQVFEHLSAYADDEATSDEAAIVETHIAVCSECAEHLHFITTASSVFDSLPQVDPPASLHAAILAATIDRPTWQQRMRSALSLAFSPAGFRYGALAGSVAAAAWIAIRVAMPIDEIPVSESRVVGLKPAIPAASPIASADSSTLFTRSLDTLMTREPSVESTTARTTVVKRAVPAITAPPQIAKASVGRPQGASATLLASTSPRDTTKTKTFVPSESGDSEIIEPSDVLPMEPMQPFDMGAAEHAATNVAAAQPTVRTGGQPAPASVHIALASYSEPAPSTQLVTLADLKRSLRRQAMDERSRFITESINEKKIRFDVVRSRF